MDKLLSDSAKTEISKKVMDILRAYHISNWHSRDFTMWIGSQKEINHICGYE